MFSTSGPRGTDPEVRLDERQHPLGVDVAREGQRRVSRMVETLEERAHVVERRRAEIVGAADGEPVIRVLRREEGAHRGHGRHAVRPVLVVLAPLVQHDLALVDELRLGQRRQQVPHAVRFHPERELEAVGRHHFPVVRAVRVRRAVEDAAGLLEGLEVAVVVVRRTLEHQVLEQVCEARAARLLVLRSDVVPEVHGDDRAPVVLVDQDRQAVGQHVLRIGDVHCAPIQRYHEKRDRRASTRTAAPGRLRPFPRGPNEG